MRRGDIWWAELGEPAGRRPVVLLSRNEAYSVRELVTVAPVTTRIRKIPVEVRLGKEDGLPRTCVINLDIITTIPRSCLSACIEHLSPGKLKAVNDAIRFALALDG